MSEQQYEDYMAWVCRADRFDGFDRGDTYDEGAEQTRKWINHCQSFVGPVQPSRVFDDMDDDIPF